MCVCVGGSPLHRDQPVPDVVVSAARCSTAWGALVPMRSLFRGAGDNRAHMLAPVAAHRQHNAGVPVCCVASPLAFAALFSAAGPATTDLEPTAPPPHGSDRANAMRAPRSPCYRRRTGLWRCSVSFRQIGIFDSRGPAALTLLPVLLSAVSENSVFRCCQRACSRASWQRVTRRLVHPRRRTRRPPHDQAHQAGASQQTRWWFTRWRRGSRSSPHLVGHQRLSPAVGAARRSIDEWGECRSWHMWSSTGTCCPCLLPALRFAGRFLWSRPAGRHHPMPRGQVRAHALLASGTTPAAVQRGSSTQGKQLQYFYSPGTLLHPHLRPGSVHNVTRCGALAPHLRRPCLDADARPGG